MVRIDCRVDSPLSEDSGLVFKNEAGDLDVTNEQWPIRETGDDFEQMTVLHSGESISELVVRRANRCR